MKPGTKVGAERWPYAAAHPDCWSRPWAGTVLTRDDPRAWKGSLAFGDREVSQKEIRAHVARHPSLKSQVPVLWDFNGDLRVYWEREAALRPYAEDLEAWMQARNATRKEAA